MRLRKKAKSGDESYWKSFTDIMAGLLMVILLVLMLLLLYMTQMNKDTHKYDHEYDYSQPYDIDDDRHEDRQDDKMYERPPQEGGGGGSGDGEDEPGSSNNKGEDNDYGHDKAAVFVTVVDEETGKAIKKAGITFQLHNDRDAAGKAVTLNTYYPTKVAYKTFETTAEGSFFLPEKIPFGWYSLHNLKAPKGYSYAENANFEVTESRDWANPYQVIIPMSPSKSVIYLRTLDADTKKSVGGATYEVTAEEDITTLDGTVRVKAGTKVCDIKCDSSGKGASPKLYFGKYSVKQKTAAKYYATATKPMSVNLDYLESKDKVYDFLCSKTRYELTLADEETKEPIPSATFTVTEKGEVKTDEKGRILLTDLEKKQSYTMTLTGLPEPYRAVTKEITFKVDENGLIDGKESSETEMTAYIIRLTVSVRDQLFGNELTSSEIRLYDANNEIVEEWTATGEKELFENLDPGTYTLEVDGNKSNRQSIELKDKPGKQVLDLIVWTFWDTAAIIGAIIGAALIIALITGLIRSRKKKKDEEA